MYQSDHGPPKSIFATPYHDSDLESMAEEDEECPTLDVKNFLVSPHRNMCEPVVNSIFPYCRCRISNHIESPLTSLSSLAPFNVTADASIAKEF